MPGVQPVVSNSRKTDEFYDRVKKGFVGIMWLSYELKKRLGLRMIWLGFFLRVFFMLETSL